MRIVHAIQGLGETSGVSYFVVEVCNRLAEMGHEVTILYSTSLRYAPCAKVRTVRADTLDALGFSPDVVHVNGIWSLFCLRAMRWCAARHLPYVVSPHGSLMPHVFKTGWLKKNAVYWLLLRPWMTRANVIHVTAAAERQACERMRLPGPYAEIPLGIDMPSLKAGGAGADTRKRRTILFVSRLGREKGLEVLLEAWKRLSRRLAAEGTDLASGWRLVLAGPDWFGNKKTLERKIAREGIAGVEFPGPLFGEAKDRAYRECDAFVLPSFNENFSMSVLEALSYAKPCIVSTGAPWEAVAERSAGYWIPPTVDEFEAALGRMIRLTDGERHMMGMNGRMLAAEKFSWPAICQAMEEVYKP